MTLKPPSCLMELLRLESSTRSRWVERELWEVLEQVSQLLPTSRCTWRVKLSKKPPEGTAELQDRGEKDQVDHRTTPREQRSLSSQGTESKQKRTPPFL